MDSLQPSLMIFWTISLAPFSDTYLNDFSVLLSGCFMSDFTVPFSGLFFCV